MDTQVVILDPHTYKAHVGRRPVLKHLDLSGGPISVSVKVTMVMLKSLYSAVIEA